MKISFVLYILVSLNLLAQVHQSVELEMGLGHDRYGINCLYQSSGVGLYGGGFDVYLCKDKNKTYYLKKDNSLNDWSALELDDKKLKTVDITRVKKDKETLYLPGRYAGVVDSDPNTLIRRNTELENMQRKFYELFVENEMDSTDKIKNFKAIAKESLDSELSQLKRTYKDHSKVVVTTHDDQELECIRPIGPKPKFQCLHYRCKSITVDGEEYKVSLRGADINTSMVTPYITSYGAGDLGPDMLIKQIKIEDKLLYSKGKPKKDNRKKLLPKKYSKSERVINGSNNPIMRMYRKSELADCDDDELNNFELALNKRLKKTNDEIQELKLVELVKNINGYWQREHILSTDITSQMCNMGGDVYYYDKAKFNNEVEKRFEGFTSTAKLVSKDRLDELFDFAVAQKDIPYAYYQDGCYVRAHVLSNRIEKELGIDTEKIWATGPVAPPNDDTVQWSYHVAPKVNVQSKNGKVESYVLDPSVSDKPLLEDEWINLISINKNIAKTTTSWPPSRDTGAIKNIQVSYTANEIYGFAQKNEMIDSEFIRLNNEKAASELKMYRSYLDEN